MISFFYFCHSQKISSGREREKKSLSIISSGSNQISPNLVSAKMMIFSGGWGVCFQANFFYGNKKCPILREKREPGTDGRILKIFLPKNWLFCSS
jgi:hypothetical protein